MAVALNKKFWEFSPARRTPVKRLSLKTPGQRWLVNFLLGLCLVGLALLHVWVRLQVLQMGYVLSTTSKLQSHLEQENRELKLELATLTSPERLQELAQTRLGLREPEKHQVVVLP
jgi:cell division protein FtsL